MRGGGYREFYLLFYFSILHVRMYKVHDRGDNPYLPYVAWEKTYYAQAHGWTNYVELRRSI